MSRRKKSKSLPGAPKASSFQKIRDQIKIKHASSLPLNWFDTTVKGKKSHFFPYRARNQILLDMCGTYEIKTKIPSEWSQIFSNGLNSESHQGRALCDVMLKITDEEYRLGKLDNKKFNALRKKLGLKKKDISKPSIVEIICLAHSMWSCNINISKIKTMLSKERIRSSITKVYFSCDPWDIARMGVGNGSTGSCLNLIDGGHTNLLFSNLQDPDMLVAYVESDKCRFAVDGMKARVLIRLMKSEGRRGIVLDKVYGNLSYRMAFTSAMQQATENTDVNMWEFRQYNHKDSHTAFVDRNNCRELIGSSGIHSYRNQLPYLDQQRNGGWNELHRYGKNTLALYQFKLVEQNE